MSRSPRASQLPLTPRRRGRYNCTHDSRAPAAAVSGRVPPRYPAGRVPGSIRHRRVLDSAHTFVAIGGPGTHSVPGPFCLVRTMTPDPLPTTTMANVLPLASIATIGSLLAARDRQIAAFDDRYGRHAHARLLERLARPASASRRSRRSSASAASVSASGACSGRPRRRPDASGVARASPRAAGASSSSTRRSARSTRRCGDTCRRIGSASSPHRAASASASSASTTASRC